MLLSASCRGRGRSLASAKVADSKVLSTRFVGNAADSYKAVRPPNAKPKLSPSPLAYEQGLAFALTGAHPDPSMPP